GILDVVRGAVGRQMNPNSTRSPNARAGINNFQQETGTVFNTSTVIILPLICAVLQELINEITVGRVNFNAIEPGITSMACCIGEILDNVGNLFGVQSTGN